MRKLAIIAAAATALIAPVQASAAATISCTTTACTFGNNDPTVVASKFADVFTFTVPYARTFIGQVSSTSVNFPVDNVNFVFFNGIQLDGKSFTIVSSGLNELRTFTGVIAAGTHTISVNGSSGPDGFYNGSATLAGVPEPTSWALMILGFGAIGTSMRVRRRAARSVAA